MLLRPGKRAFTTGDARSMLLGRLTDEKVANVPFIGT
jgi:hypothetical protein